MAQRDYDAFYAFLERHRFAIAVTRKANLCAAGAHFYFQHSAFDRALRLLSLVRCDETLLAEHVTVELAFCHEQAEQWRLAVEYYALSLRREGKLGERGRSECLHHMGAVHFNQLRDYAAALGNFLGMGDAEIDRRDLESAIASCYDQLKQPRMALTYFKRYEVKFPDKPAVLLAVAVVHWKLGQLKKADRYFGRALENSSSWMLHSKYGYYLLNGKKEYARALEHFSQSLALASTAHQKSESYKCMGATCDKRGDMERASGYTQKVLDANPDDADALNNAGYFHLLQRSYDDAYRHLARSLELCPDGELTTGNLGVCLFQMGEPDQALPFLRRAVDERPSDLEHADVGPRCLECLARLLFEHKHEHAQSLAVLRQLLQHSAFERLEHKDEVMFLMSRVYREMGDFAASLKALKKAKKLNPQRTLYETQIRILKNGGRVQSK